MTVVKLLQARPGATGPLVLGETFLEKFEVRALLGTGGHAWVYECFDRFLKRLVAVKVIKTLREAGRDLGPRAQAEAQVLAGMAHPNLVRVIDAGIGHGLVYIVMEKLEGRTLRHALMDLGRLSVRESLDIALQIAGGMQLAHESGVIHRDLKPENIFIERGHHVKVLDFGVAKVLGTSQVTTQKDRLQGTLFYMSPEQLQGVAVTPASDVFALGTMLFEMLYSHPLTLGGELRNTDPVAWMQLYEVPPPLESLDQRIPRYIGKLVARAIVKLPSDRYRTMRQFRDAALAALRRYETERSVIENAATRRAPAPPARRATVYLQREPPASAEPLAARAKREESKARSLSRLRKLSSSSLLGGLGLSAVVLFLGATSPFQSAGPRTRPVLKSLDLMRAPIAREAPALPRLAAPPAPASLSASPTPPLSPRRRRLPVTRVHAMSTTAKAKTAEKSAKAAPPRLRESIF